LQTILSEMGERTKGDLSKISTRAEELYQLGFGVADAAHLAFAEFHGAEFISCDDRLIKKSLSHQIGVWCGSPLAFCEKEGLR
jgi:predicted nucleic acid-binding protein